MLPGSPPEARGGRLRTGCGPTFDGRGLPDRRSVASHPASPGDGRTGAPGLPPTLLEAPMSKLLSDASVTEALSRLDGWEHDAAEGAIARKFIFDDFDEAMAFILEVADIARAMDHHPELHNVYNEVALSLTTHDAGGLTSKDVEFATRVEALFASDEP